MAIPELSAAKAAAAGNAAKAGLMGEIEREAIHGAMAAKGVAAAKTGGAAAKVGGAGKTVGAAAKVGGAAKGMTGGTIWPGKGLSLGWGLGPWVTVALGVLCALAVYGYLRSRENRYDLSEIDLEIQEALG